MTDWAAWKRLRPHIEAALTTCPTHDIEHVEQGLADGTLQFWPGENCAVVTEIAAYPKGRMLHFWLLGGDLRELMQMRDRIEQFGRAMGCKWAAGEGRKVWGRVLSKHGYREVASELLKEL